MLQKAVASAHRAVFKASHGRIGGMIGKAPVLLLTTTGRKSGLARTTPLLYASDGDNLVVVASNGGAANHPTWYLNLSANPDVTVETRGASQPRKARMATEEERSRLWTVMQALYKGYDGYQTKTDRHIPIVILEPA